HSGHAEGHAARHVVLARGHQGCQPQGRRCFPGRYRPAVPGISAMEAGEATGPVGTVWPGLGAAKPGDGVCQTERHWVVERPPSRILLRSIRDASLSPHADGAGPNTASARLSKADAKRRKAVSNITPISSPSARLRNS